MRAGVPLTQRQLDDACEAHLQQRFGEKLDFAVENSLPFLIHDGLIKETGDVSALSRSCLGQHRITEELHSHCCLKLHPIHYSCQGSLYVTFFISKQQRISVSPREH